MLSFVFLTSNSIATLAVHSQSEFNRLKVDEKRHVTGLTTDPGLMGKDTEGVLAFTGIAVYRAEFLQFLPTGISSVVDGWFKLIPVAGAVFLPWIAVIIANGSDLAEGHSGLLLDSAPLAELEAPAAAGVDDDPGSTLLQGELIDESDLNGQFHNPNPGEERRAS